jgi:hypothetical protein
VNIIRYIRIKYFHIVDVTPSKFHLFGPLMDALQGCLFVDDDNLKYSMCEEPRRFSKGFHVTGIQRMNAEVEGVLILKETMW